MPTIVLPLSHDLAVIAALQTLGKPVGFAEAPAGALSGVQNRTGPDYLILFPTSSTRDGSLADPYADAEFVYSVMCVGRRPDGARFLPGQLESALAGVTIAGRSVVQVIPEDHGGVRPANDVDPPVFVGAARFRLVTTPA